LQPKKNREQTNSTRDGERSAFGLTFMSPSRLKRSRSIGDLYSKREAFGLDMTGEFAAAWLPAIFVPMTGIVFPAVFIVLVGRVITAAE
jgi:photosystem I subunit 8